MRFLPRASRLAVLAALPFIYQRLWPVQKKRILSACLVDDQIELAQLLEWDSEMMDWWNPCAKSFRDVMSKRGKKTREPKDSIYGVIEIDREGNFFAYTQSVKKGPAPSAIGRTADEAKRLLEEKIKIMLNRESVSLVLTSMTPLEDHQCSFHQS